MSKKIVLISIILMLCVPNIAIARRMWVKTPVEVDGMPVHGRHCALAMRSGNTWPVVSYGDHESCYTAAMTPVGWMPGPGTGDVHGGIGAATSPGGTAGFAYGNGFVRMLTPTGWTTSCYSSGTDETKPSIAFNGDNNPAVLHNTDGDEELTLAVFNGGGWYQNVVENPEEGPFWSDAFALEYDSYNQANIVFESGELWFGVKGVLTQYQWEFDIIEPDLGSPSVVDMAMGAGDVPWITYTDESYLYYATYDRQQQDWVSGILGQVEPGDNYFSMAANSTGGIGVAFIDSSSILTYAYTDGTGVWTYDMGIAGTAPLSDVGLAFDADDNPVICYFDYDHGELYLAYDPEVIPEPATVMLFAIGAAMLRRRQRP